MKVKSILGIALIVTIYACGPKVTKSTETLVKETQSYMSKVDAKNNLTEETTQGALTDSKGYKDIGTFKYTTFYSKKTSELFKIKNVETTTNTITETYYFEANALVAIKSESSNGTKIVLLNNGKVISEKNLTPQEKKDLLKKAKRFKKAFENE